MFEPQKFFIGIVDLFSILLPGAMFVWVLRPQPLDSAAAWVVFAFASYLTGHLAFLFGSALDGMIYDPLRTATERASIRRLADGERPRNAFLRLLARGAFGGNPDRAVMLAEGLKNRALSPIAAGRAVNAFQWSKILLGKEHPEALATVQGFEAHSKFFRTFAVVLVGVAVVYLLEQEREAVLVALVLLLPVLWRYVDQRFKATQQAYWSVLTLAARDPQAPAQTSRPTHAGGVVFDQSGSCLFVKATNTEEWVLPKGHLEPGESAAEGAVREVLEETGCWAGVRGSLGEVQFGPDVSVSFFRMELVRFDEKREGVRDSRWMTPEQAATTTPFAETRVLLTAAVEQRKKENDKSGRKGGLRAALAP